MHEVACPGCGGESHLLGGIQNSHWFAGAPLSEPVPGGNLYRCRRCFLKFRHPLLDAGTYQHLYDNSLTTAWVVQDRPDWDRIVRYLHQTFPQGCRVLDFGCNRGELLNSLEQKYKKHGIEINRSAAAVAATLDGIKVWHALDEMPGDLRFDAIVTADVVEHVPNPEMLIARLMSLLDKDGVLVITTGDADNPLWNAFGSNWWYCFIPEHISFISARWLEYFSAKHGVQILHLEKFRYVRLGKLKYLLDSALTVFYGLAPRLYLRAGAFVKKLLGRYGEFAPRGIGVSADHILAVLARQRSMRAGSGLTSPPREP